MKQYLELVRDIRDNGSYKCDRTGTGTLSVFGRQMRFDLSDGSFPLVTTKQCHLKSIIHELLWFLKGETNIRYLKENGVSIWDEWVLPGTEEYRDMDVQRMQELLRTHFLKKEGYETCSFVYRPASDELTDTPTHGQCQMYIKGKDITISVLDHPEVDEKEELRVFFREVLKREAKDLIAGELGPVYGSQWRSWPDPRPMKEALERIVDLPSVRLDESGQCARDGLESHGIDQLANLIEMIKKNPDSRRLIVSAWNPAEVDQMALPPCHALFQFYSAVLTWEERWKIAAEQGYDVDQFRGCVVSDIMENFDQWGIPKRRLSCQLYQRSADIGLGVPFNIASYALLLMMVAQVTDHAPGEFIWTGGDCHIYSNHLEQIDLQLTRDPHPLPTMKINPQVRDIFDFKYEDFSLENYVSHPHIAMPLAV